MSSKFEMVTPEERYELQERRLKEAEANGGSTPPKKPKKNPGSMWNIIGAIVGVVVLLGIIAVCISLAVGATKAKALVEAANAKATYDAQIQIAQKTAEDAKKTLEEQQTAAVKAAEDAKKALDERLEKAEKDAAAQVATMKSEFEEQLKALAEKAEVASNVSRSPVQIEREIASATTPAGREIRMGVDEFEDSITTKNNDGYVDMKNVAEFKRMFDSMSPPEEHPQFGTVSYVLMKGKNGKAFCHGDRPPIVVPAGYSDFREDNTGRWMAVK